MRNQKLAQPSPSLRFTCSLALSPSPSLPLSLSLSLLLSLYLPFPTESYLQVRVTVLAISSSPLCSVVWGESQSTRGLATDRATLQETWDTLPILFYSSTRSSGKTRGYNHLTPFGIPMLDSLFPCERPGGKHTVKLTPFLTWILPFECRVHRHGIHIV